MLDLTINTLPQHVHDISEMNEFPDKITISINQKLFYFARAKLIHCCIPTFGSTRFWFYSDDQIPNIQEINAPVDHRRQEQRGHSCYNLILEKNNGTITCRLQLADDGAIKSYGTMD